MIDVGNPSKITNAIKKLQKTLEKSSKFWIKREPLKQKLDFIVVIAQENAECVRKTWDKLKTDRPLRRSASLPDFVSLVLHKPQLETVCAKIKLLNKFLTFKLDEGQDYAKIVIGETDIKTIEGYSAIVKAFRDKGRVTFMMLRSKLMTKLKIMEKFCRYYVQLLL